MFCYRISSIILNTNFRIPHFSNYEVSTSTFNKDIKSQINNTDYAIIYSGNGIIEESECYVNLGKDKSGYILSIHGIARFYIERNGKFIYILESYINTDNHKFLSAFTGPVLIFALALNNIFCIHASAVREQNRAVLLIADSGFGKSTIAANLNLYNDKISRISDDIVPVCLKSNNLYALPHFPQLKLNDDEQYPLEHEDKLRISHIYILDKRDKLDEIELANMRVKELTQNLIKQTLSSVLFDRDILNSHLQFCTKGLGSFISKQLIFSHKTGAIPKLCQTIINDLSNTA